VIINKIIILNEINDDYDVDFINDNNHVISCNSLHFIYENNSIIFIKAVNDSSTELILFLM